MLRSLILTTALAGLVAFAVPRPVSAESSGGANNPTNLSNSCDGLFWPPTKGNHGEYGCLNKGGGGIVCGGATAAQKGSCYRFTDALGLIPKRSQIESTFRVSPPRVAAKPK